MGLIGGIFAPALFIGSSLGVITFYVGSLLFPDINPTIIIISSMAVCKLYNRRSNSKCTNYI